MRPHRRIVARDDALRGEQLLNGCHDKRSRTIHPLVQSLYREVIAVTIDDQGGEAIAFRMNQTVRVCVGDQPLAISLRRGNLVFEEGSVCLHGLI